MNLDREQFCSECGDPTGRAGNFHDSVFVFDGHIKHGPLCDSCTENLSKQFNVEITYI